MALQVGEMLITVYWPNRTGLLLCEGAHGGAEKTTTVMITHRGALDNTQCAVTAAGHLCYAQFPASVSKYLPATLNYSHYVLVQPVHTTSSAHRTGLQL